MIECAVCGKQFGFMNCRHLKIHGLSTEQYRQRFPKVPIVSKEWKKSHIFDSKRVSSAMKQAWADGKFQDRKDCSEALKGYFRKNPPSPDLISYRNACHSRAKRIKNGYQMTVKDNNGKSAKLQFTPKRDERPLVQHNGGAVYRDDTIFPCVGEEDLRTLIQKWAAPEGFNLRTLRFEAVKG